MSIIIPFANQKGGVAKTTSVVTLGHGLAAKGFSTLIVDTDPQGHVAFSLGMEKSPGLFRLILEEADLSEIATQARPNLDIVASDKTTEKVKRYVVSMDYREKVLIDVLADARYDIILLDTAPSLDALHVAVLAAADLLIIPTKLEAMAVDGVNEVLKSYAQVAQHEGKAVDFYVLPTFFERVTKETIFQLKAVVESFGDRVWPPIPTDTKAREASAYGQTLLEYAPGSAAMTGYIGERGKRLGGYVQALGRLQEVIHG